jgi:hypothetical protein
MHNQLQPTSVLLACSAALGFMLVTANTAFAAQEIPEPEYVGNILMIQDNSGIPLEKQRASNHARSGFLKAKSSNIVQGAQSSVRAATGENLTFIVRHSTNDVDPVQVVNIFKLTSDIKRDYRYIETGSRGMFTGDSMKIEFLPFSSKRYGKFSYQLTISQPLSPGEYAMTLDGTRDVFSLFGVD